MNSKAYKLPNGKKVIFEYDITGVGKITLECMDELMSMIANRPQDDSVSRRYLLAEIDDLADEFSELDENGLHSERWCGIMDSKRIIMNTPFANRPQGEWIVHSNGKMCDCSVCNESYDRTFEYVDEWNFCPNCGADMRERKESE